MRKLGIALLALGLCAMALPALALPPIHPAQVANDTQGTALRSPECLGDVVWDTGMNDTWVRPAGGFSAKLSQCIVNALDQYGYAGYEYRCADDWIADWRPITSMKILSTMYNCADFEADPARLHGFCIKFYEAIDDPPWCPDGTVTGWDAIGTLVYDQYSTDYTVYTVIAANKYAHCVNFPTPFQPAIPGHAYWASVTGDYDLIVDPANANWLTLFYWRVYGGGDPYSPFCEAVNATDWAGFSATVAWTGISGTYTLVRGWNMGFRLFDNFVFPNGACCDPATGACTVTIAHDCIAPSVWHGEWTSCDPNNCPQPPRPGACCDPLGVCTHVVELECQAPSTFIPDGVCDPNPCPQPTGACCDLATGVCTLTTQLDCTFSWLGANVPCDAQTCPAPLPRGACCIVATGVCTNNVLAADCHGAWTPGVVCSVQLCPPPPPVGACCAIDGTCTMTMATQCTGLWHADWTCTPNQCPQPVPVERKTWGGVKNSYR